MDKATSRSRSGTIRHPKKACKKILNSVSGATLLCWVLAQPVAAESREKIVLPTDKAAHFGLSSVAVEASMKSCQAWEDQRFISSRCRWASTSAVLMAGVLKEFADQKRGGRFDQQDLVADILGVISGNLLQWNF